MMYVTGFEPRYPICDEFEPSYTPGNACGEGRGWSSSSSCCSRLAWTVSCSSTSRRRRRRSTWASGCSCHSWRVCTYTSCNCRSAGVCRCSCSCGRFSWSRKASFSESLASLVAVARLVAAARMLLAPLAPPVAFARCFLSIFCQDQLDKVDVVEDNWREADSHRICFDCLHLFIPISALHRHKA